MGRYSEHVISIDEARALVAHHAAPLRETETVTLDEALGRVLAVPLCADRDDPPFARSLMDGYAVRAAETPGSFRVVARIAAGADTLPTLQPGEAAWINTGAPVPPGADAVVKVEDCTDERDAHTSTEESVGPGHNMLARGALANAGAVAVDGVLTPERLAVCAAIGASEVTVRRLPRIVILATGSELQATPGRHEIRNSNGPMLRAVMARYRPDDRGTVGDDPAALAGAIESALNDADVVITTGGVSKGELDLVRPTLEARGSEIVFHGVALQPGKPVLFARDGACAFFGLPGNPASALVCADLLVLPYLAAVAGRAAGDVLLERQATATGAVRASKKRRRVFPCWRRPDGSVDPLPWRSSADLYTLARGNGYLVIEREQDLAAGDRATLLIPERFGPA